MLTLPVFTRRDLLDEEYRRDLARSKRLLEAWSAHTAVRDALAENAAEAWRRYALARDPEEVRGLWDFDHALHPDQPLAVHRYRAWITEKLKFRDVIRREGTPDEPTYALWRQRHMNRTAAEVGLNKAEGLVHAPCAFELSRGCSVGCWFCGISAPKLSDLWLYTEENRQLWRETLTVLKEVIGPAARRGFCYWATDPMDNPDYEKFCCDFSAILGRFPQTTTALPLRDVERTRRLLQLSEERGCDVNRFSVLTWGIFQKIFAEFTPEELLNVELIPQNKESWQVKARAGRALDSRRDQELPDREAGVNSTIACVSGFLFKMLDRTVELITPCNADEVWPLGYRIYGKATFEDAASLREALHSLIGKMKVSIRANDVLKLRRGVRLRLTEDGFEAVSKLLTQRFEGRALGEALLEERVWTAAELALHLEGQAPLEQTFHQLNALFRVGVLDDDPAG